MHRKKLCFFNRFVASVVLVNFLATTFLPAAYAQEIFLPAPGSMVRLSPSFNPPILKGIKVYPDNPFLFDFILDNGKNAATGDTDEAGKLVKYFLASLTTPENDMWVNLSPYEKDRIVPESFGQTEMGRDLLAQDYMLKQITASLIYPEDELGKKFWDRVYAEAKKKFGTTDIPVNTFNKVWIVPAKAVVYENPQSASAYVIDSKLKVMLEEDYVALSHQKDRAKSPATAGDVAPNETNQIGNQIVREIVIPALTKEVNEGKNFSQLRQIYNSLILAAWYKKKIKDSILSQVYVDKNKVAGVDIDDPQEKQLIYEQYLEAFKKGAYNYIKEEVDLVTNDMIPKKYFSGGFSAKTMDMDVLDVTRDPAVLSASSGINGQIMQVQIASSSITDERADLLATAEYRFEKPYSNLVQIPERELNEKVAERNSAVEIQMELDRLLAELGMIVSQQEIPGLFEVGLDEREAGFLRNLRSLYQSMPVPVHDELPFAEVSQLLKDLRASRNRIYAAIEKADRENNSEALKDLNRQAIRNNRLILKAQILVAGKMMAGKSNLKGRDIILGAVGASLNGAMNTAQHLKRELGYRIGRLQAAKMVREIETTDWLGRIIRTYRMSGFDIEVSPTTKDGQDPTVTVRQQYWVNAHTRLNQILTDLRTGRLGAAQIQLDNLRNLYNVKHLIIYEKYREIAEGIRQLRERTANLREGVKLSPDQVKVYSDEINKLKDMIDNPKQRVWVDVEIEDIDAAFRGYLHRFAGYIEEIGTISYQKTTLEFFASLLKDADQAKFLSKRNLAILLEGLAPIVEWAQRGMVYQKQRVVINLEPAVEKINGGDYSGAQEDMRRAAGQLQERLREIESIVANSKKQAASVFSAYRDKDINRRTEGVSKSVVQRDFESAFRDLETLLELYFNQDQVEPGYVRAEMSLHKLVGLVRAAQRIKDPSGIIAQGEALLKLVRDDVAHKYSLKVYVVENNGKKTFAYVNPGTTVAGFLKIRGLDPQKVQVSLGAKWLKPADLNRTRIAEKSTVTIRTSRASSAIPDVKRDIVRLSLTERDLRSFGVLSAKEDTHGTQAYIYKKDVWPFVLKLFVGNVDIGIFSQETQGAYELAYETMGGIVHDFIPIQVQREDGMYLHAVIMRKVPIDDLAIQMQTLLSQGQKEKIKTLIDQNVELVLEILRRGVFPIDIKFKNFGMDRNRQVVIDPGFFEGEYREKKNMLTYSFQVNFNFLKDTLGSEELAQYYRSRLNEAGLWKGDDAGIVPGLWQTKAPVRVRDISVEVEASFKGQIPVEYLSDSVGQKDYFVSHYDKANDPFTRAVLDLRLEPSQLKADDIVNQNRELVINRLPKSIVDVDIVVGVPPSNPQNRTVEYLANAFADLLTQYSHKTISADHGILLKSRATGRQYDLAAEQREGNVKDAFTVNQDLTGKNILLLDDVRTTGFTLQETRKALEAAGARVIAVSLLPGFVERIKANGVVSTTAASPAVEVKTISLPSGAQLLSRFPVSIQFLQGIATQQRLSEYDGRELTLKRTFYKYLNTSLDDINKDLGVDLVAKIAQLDQERKISNLPNRTITILDWGAGQGRALGEIKDELDKRGIRNVRLIGFGNNPFREWLDLPAGVEMILDQDNHLDKYFVEGEIDMIYSHLGLYHLYGTGRWIQLAKLLKVNGRIFWESNPEEDDIVEATGMVQKKENSPWGKEHVFYLEKSAANMSASSAIEATKGGVDFNADKLNLETQTTGGEIKFEMDPEQLRELQNVPGFTPVIINIQPMINVQMFLGLKEGAETPLAISKVQ
ncbi:MAG: hypothetical protein IT395_01255 [Candidatus Omnitrophica bacterium]|nr:hypothetical protein [Candidatus Omnitrophota bacterium]